MQNPSKFIKNTFFFFTTSFFTTKNILHFTTRLQYLSVKKDVTVGVPAKHMKFSSQKR